MNIDEAYVKCLQKMQPINEDNVDTKIEIDVEWAASMPDYDLPESIVVTVKPTREGRKAIMDILVDSKKKARAWIEDESKLKKSVEKLFNGGEDDSSGGSTDVDGAMDTIFYIGLDEEMENFKSESLKILKKLPDKLTFRVQQ